MLNQLVTVGRLTKDIEVHDFGDGNKKAYITLAIPRSFKNKDGEYETDFVDYELFGPIAENTAEYCKKGDIVGIKGRVESRSEENKDGYKFNKTVLIAEKVTFLSSRSKDIPESER